MSLTEMMQTEATVGRWITFDLEIYVKNAELIARLRVIAGKRMADYFNSGHPNSNAITDAADAIEALEAQLKNASVAAIAEAAEVDRLQAEVERLTTLAHGQHIELYNARLQLAAALQLKEKQ